MTKLTNAVSALRLFIVVGCVLTALGTGLGYRFGWWHFGTGIAAVAVVPWIAAGTAAVCAVGVVLALTVAPRQSFWIYPLVNAAHILGVALLVGAIVPMDLRLLGARHSRMCRNPYLRNGFGAPPQADLFDRYVGNHATDTSGCDPHGNSKMVVGLTARIDRKGAPACVDPPAAATGFRPQSC